MDNRGIGVRSSAGARMKTGSGCFPDSYVMGAAGSFRVGVKWLRRKLITAFDGVPKIRISGAVSPLPHAPSWCGTWLSTGRPCLLLPLTWCNSVFRQIRCFIDCCMSYCS
jgi:hypothetical protein